MLDGADYQKYRNSQIKWIGNIPAHWNVTRLKYLAELNRQTLPERMPPGFQIDYVDIGSVSFERGVERTERFEFDSAPSRARRIAVEGDTVVSTVRTYLKAIDYIDAEKSNYVYSTGFAILHPKKINPRFVTAFIWSMAFTNQVADQSNGVSYPAINSTDLSNLHVVEPPRIEQLKIVQYLDAKVKRIDEAIRVKKQQVTLLKERKQILIQNAVTRGLNPDAPMRDSGVDWIGEIPSNWSVCRAKYLFREVDERSQDGSEELLSVSHVTGVTPRSEKNVNMFMAEDYTGSKTCQKGDLVFNIMWAWMGALGVSDRAGIVSSSYGVFQQRNPGVFNAQYLEMLLKATGYIEHYNKVSTGLHSSRLRFYPHMFMAMEIGYPDREEQDAIVDYIVRECRKLNKAGDLLEQQITKLKEYKASLINSAVTGKIKVPGVVEPEGKVQAQGTQEVPAL